MKKQIILLTIAFTFAILVSEAVSAVNTTSNAYLVGQDVTQQATSDNMLAMNQSQGNLVITTAGTSSLNGATTEDSIQAIVDYTSTLSQGQAITYGSGNLLTINDPNGPLDFTFVSLGTNGALWAKHFGVSSTGTVTAGDTVYINAYDMTQTQWNYAMQQLGSNAFNLMNIANLWAKGAPADLMALTYTNGGLNQNTIANYAETKPSRLNIPTQTLVHLAVQIT